ncbi:MAG: hypothetical protein AB2A00_30135 [Myxococcota bacterium]
MAAHLSADDGKLDKSDVRAMLVRATASGKLERKDAEDLCYVRERYKNQFTSQALAALDSVVGAFVQEELQRMKEKERQKKIDKHLLQIEERIEFLLKDRKLRELKVDDKQRVMIGDLFGRRKTA